MKNKGLPMWQRIGNWFDDLTFIQAWILGCIIGGVIGITLVALGVIHRPLPTEIYQSTYDDCMAQEDTNRYLCHQIALERVGD